MLEQQQVVLQHQQAVPYQQQVVLQQQHVLLQQQQAMPYQQQVVLQQQHLVLGQHQHPQRGMSLLFFSLDLLYKGICCTAVWSI